MKKEIYMSYQEHQQFVGDIARQIESEKWVPDYIVGLTRGGLLPATMLSHKLDVPMYSLDVSLRDNNDGMGPTSNAWMAEDALTKQILIVDDINDSGATLDWIMNDWKASNRPFDPAWDIVFGNSVRVAVIVNNEPSKFNRVSYSGMEINKDREDVWIVFPWEEWWK